MDADDVRRLFDGVRTAKAGDTRAPHKPLVLLAALARVQAKAPRLQRYADLSATVDPLLEQILPHKSSSDMPVSYLLKDRSDGSRLWEIPEEQELRRMREGTSKPDLFPANLLRERDARAGFDASVHGVLANDPRLVNELAALLLESNFPRTQHDDILEAIAMPWVTEAQAIGLKVPVDPEFRKSLLDAYKRTCAICGFNGSVGGAVIALEAAHVQWRAYGGPDRTDNGLLLCSLHHKAFDIGAIGLDEDRRIRVSEQVAGGPQSEAMLDAFQGMQLRGPFWDKPAPALQFIKWHQHEVFRG